MAKLAQRFIRDDAGSVNIEYGMIAVLVGVLLVGALTQISVSIGTIYNAISNSFS